MLTLSQSIKPNLKALNNALTAECCIVGCYLVSCVRASALVDSLVLCMLLVFCTSSFLTTCSGKSLGNTQALVLTLQCGDHT